MSDGIVTYDIRQALAALKRLRKSILNTNKEAEKGFDRSAVASGRARDEFGRFVATGTKGSKTLGTAIGGLASPLGLATVAVGALGFAFVQLARVATKAFIDITKGGIELNKQFETSARVFSNLFDDPNLGKATIDFLRQTANELRINQADAIGFAQSILPRTSDLETFRELLRLTDIQADVTGQSVGELEFSIREALTGDFVSLKDRFDVSRETINQIKELGEEIGLDKALVEVLGAEFERLGKADISGTLQTDLKDIQISLTNFQVLVGEAPFEELKEQAEGFLGVLDEQGENIGFVAEAFGDLAANVIDFIGTNVNEFVASIDFEAIERLVDAFNLALSAGQLVIDVLFDIPDTQEGIENTTQALLDTKDALEDVAVAAGKLKIALQAAFVFAKALFQVSVSKDFLGAIETLTELSDVSSLENQEEAAKNTESAFERYEQRIKSIQEAQDERRDSTDKSTQADFDAIDAALANQNATEELAKAQAAATQAQEEITKKTTKAEEDRAKSLTNLLRKEANRRLDDAIKAAQRLEDIARRNADAIEDIFRKQDQAIADAGKDLSRDEQDIARNAARDRKDIERQAANERLDIERGFRRELQRIQSQFNQSALDAERNNDAQAFIQAIRAKDEQIQLATTERDVAVVDTGRQAQEQREELKIQLAAEVEDAQISNARKLEDLQTSLNRSLKAQAIKLEREIEQEAIKELRLTEQRNLAAQRDLEQLERSEAEKTARLQESLAVQFALIETAKTKELAFTARVEAQKTAIVQAEVAKRQAALASLAAAQRQAGPGALSLAPTRGDLGFARPFQRGGRPRVGEPITVGEAGPEIFVPDTAGTIIPNSAIFSPPSQMAPLQQGAAGNNITNNSTFNLAESMFTDPIARRQLTNFVLGVLAEGV